MKRSPLKRKAPMKHKAAEKRPKARTPKIVVRTIKGRPRRALRAKIIREAVLQWPIADNRIQGRRYHNERFNTKRA